MIDGFENLTEIQSEDFVFQLIEEISENNGHIQTIYLTLVKILETDNTQAEDLLSALIGSDIRDFVETYIKRN